MKIILAAFVLLCSQAAMAVTDEDTAKTLSPEQLVERAKKYDPGAIREIGRRKHSPAHDLLKSIAEEPDLDEDKTVRYRNANELKELSRVSLRNGSHETAKVALARLGEKKYTDEFVVGLSSSNVQWRAKCIRHLGEIGDKKTAKYLIQLLDNNKPVSISKKGIGDASYSYRASLALREMFPDVFDSFVKKHGGRGLTFTADWKDWWEHNKAEIEKSQ